MNTIPETTNTQFKKAAIRAEAQEKDSSIPTPGQIAESLGKLHTDQTFFLLYEKGPHYEPKPVMAKLYGLWVTANRLDTAGIVDEKSRQAISKLNNALKIICNPLTDHEMNHFSIGNDRRNALIAMVGAKENLCSMPQLEEVRSMIWHDIEQGQ